MLEGKRVLIVEDEPVIGFVLEDMLDVIGCKPVGIATRVEQALEIVAAREIDAAILDVNIHGQRSYSVADALVAQGVPFIFATGYDGTEHPSRYRQVLTLAKPYSIDDVQRALATVTAGTDAGR